jgi:hypothetical protein
MAVGGLRAPGCLNRRRQTAWRYRNDALLYCTYSTLRACEVGHGTSARAAAQDSWAVHVCIQIETNGVLWVAPPEDDGVDGRM